jgi:hypothetical protein
LRAVLLRARDAGGVALSPPLKVPNSDGPAGPAFMLVLPLYRPGAAPDTAEDRQRHLVGWVLAAFRVGDLMSSLYGEDLPGLDVRIHDGADTGEASLIYSAGPPHTAAA